MPLIYKESSSTGLAYLSSGPIADADGLVLCISGLGCPGSDYLPLLQILEKENPRNLYIAPDLPGQGNTRFSACPNPTLPAFARLLWRLCDELKPQPGKVILIGHSLGCRLALEAFSLRANAVSALVVLDGSWNGPQAPAVTLEDLPSREVRLNLILTALETMFGPNSTDTFKDEHRKLVQEADMDYQSQLALSNRRWDAESMIKSLQLLRSVSEGQHSIQLLVVQAMEGSGGPRRRLSKGEESSWMKLVREMVGDVYSCLVVEDSGHWPHVDQSFQVAQAILPLISQ